jgi:hypothetical protein
MLIYIDAPPTPLMDSTLSSKGEKNRRTYRKLRCELARKVVKGLLEKEVSQKGFAMSSDSQNAIKK